MNPDPVCADCGRDLPANGYCSCREDTPMIQIPREPLRYKPFIGMDLSDCEVKRGFITNGSISDFNPPLRFRPQFWRRIWAAMKGWSK